MCVFWGVEKLLTIYSSYPTKHFIIHRIKSLYDQLRPIDTVSKIPSLRRWWILQSFNKVPRYWFPSQVKLSRSSKTRVCYTPVLRSVTLMYLYLFFNMGDVGSPRVRSFLLQNSFIKSVFAFLRTLSFSRDVKYHQPLPKTHLHSTFHSELVTVTSHYLKRNRILIILSLGTSRKGLVLKQ